MKFHLYGSVGGSTHEVVEADSLDEALGMAEEVYDCGLCWQCSSTVELGDVYALLVEDEQGNVLLDETKTPTWQEQALAAAGRRREVTSDL